MKMMMSCDGPAFWANIEPIPMQWIRSGHPSFKILSALLPCLNIKYLRYSCRNATFNWNLNSMAVLMNLLLLLCLKWIFPFHTKTELKRKIIIKKRKCTLIFRMASFCFKLAHFLLREIVSASLT